MTYGFRIEEVYKRLARKSTPGVFWSSLFVRSCLETPPSLNTPPIVVFVTIEKRSAGMYILYCYPVQSRRLLSLINHKLPINSKHRLYMKSCMYCKQSKKNVCISEILSCAYSVYPSCTIQILRPRLKYSVQQVHNLYIAASGRARSGSLTASVKPLPALTIWIRMKICMRLYTATSRATCFVKWNTDLNSACLVFSNLWYCNGIGTARCQCRTMSLATVSAQCFQLHMRKVLVIPIPFT